MRDMANPRGGTKQIWVVSALSLVLVLCVGMLLWLVWSEPDGLPASISEGQISEPGAPFSQSSLSSEIKSSSNSESSTAPSPSSAAPNSRTVQHTSVGTTAGSAAQAMQNLTINAALTHDENATYYNIFINADGVILKNKLVTGDLVISESVANGAVTLENIVVKGRILVNGAQTVTLRDVTAVQLIAQRGSGTTDYIVEGASTIHQMAAKNQLTIDETGLSENYAGIKDLTTEQGAPMWQQVTLLKGALEQVTANDATNLMLSSGSSVEQVIANAPTHIGGSGSVYSLTVRSDEVSYEKEPRNVTVEDDYDRPSEQNWAIGQTETAVNGGNHSGASTLTLSTPHNLKIAAAAADNSVTLAFNSVSNATGYTVIYSVTNGSSTSNVTNQQLSAGTNSCTITNALIGQAGTVITFKARAVSTSSRYTASAYSDSCTKTVITLEAPADIQLSLNGSKLALTFAAAFNAAAYSHEAVLSVDGADVATLTLAPGVAAGEFTSLTAGKAHTVTVRAIGDGKLALTSASAANTYDVPALPMASNLAISNVGGDLAVTFTGASGINDYAVTLQYGGSTLFALNHSASGDVYTYLFECPDAIATGKTYTASVTPQGGLATAKTRTVQQRAQPGHPRITSSALDSVTFAFDALSGYNYSVVSATHNTVAIPGVTAANLTAAVITAKDDTFNFSVKTLGDGMFYADSETASADEATVTKLSVPLSPTISGNRNNLTLSFNTNHSESPHAIVIQTSVDDGASWSALTSDVLEAGVTQTSVATSAVAGKQVRFSVTAKAANALQVDSDAAESLPFSVVQLDPPTGLDVSYPVIDSGKVAQFSFSEASGAAAYTVSYTLSALDGTHTGQFDAASYAEATSHNVPLPDSDDATIVTAFTVTVHGEADATTVYLDATASYSAP